MMYLMLFAIGFGLGLVVARFIIAEHRRTYPTLQEKIDAVCAASTPATAEDLVRIMATRSVGGAGHNYALQMQVGSTHIKMPEREHLALLLQDIPAFEAMVTAAKAVFPDAEVVEL